MLKVTEKRLLEGFGLGAGKHNVILVFLLTLFKINTKGSYELISKN